MPCINLMPGSALQPAFCSLEGQMHFFVSDLLKVIQMCSGVFLFYLHMQCYGPIKYEFPTG